MTARDDRPDQRELRRKLREAYGCDCAGDVEAGMRRNTEQAGGALEVMKDWTGIECRGCPWRALQEPFVIRVFEMYRWFDKGQLAIYKKNPSHRELEGLTHLHAAINRMDAQQAALDRMNREQG